MPPARVAPAVRAYLPGLFTAALAATTAAAQASAPPPLEFAALRVGIPIAELRTALAPLRGSLSCRRSSDPRLAECLGTVRLAGIRGPLSLLVSSVRDSAAVLVLTAPAPLGTAERLVATLTPVQGTVQPAVRRSQRIWQWVRHRQMLRVIQRAEASAETVTVTLTDGPLLDGLARDERRRGPDTVRPPDSTPRHR